MSDKKSSPEKDSSASHTPASAVVANGSVVSLHYKGTLTDGTVFDSSEGRDPLTFTVGEHMVIPGFEKAVLGLAVGDKKKFTVAKADGYEHRSELIQKLPRATAPPGIELREGMTLALRAPTGQVVPARVTQLTETEITIDLNSPLAGKDLMFEIEILKIA